MSYTEKDCVESLKKIVRAKKHVIDAGIIFDDEKLSDILSEAEARKFYDGQKMMIESLYEAIVVESEYVEDAKQNALVEARRKASKPRIAVAMMNGKVQYVTINGQAYDCAIDEL